MSYQVLARKYRPKNFGTLVGQEHVVRALTHALDSRRLHHAYLFTGTRGVGKTTLSRILAKALNCIGTDGNGDITSQPCGSCEACSAIDAGRFVDYIEMDAASNRGVDEMAQLLEQAVYAPSNARFKVYMIDEVHMLTNHAFNSMLKTLEEPPEHVKFILATTDPQKIPVTVLSRCLQFNLKQMPPGQIIDHLENILGQEGIEFEQAALRLLAQGAHGSMRDGLSLTDQAIAYAAGKVTLDAVQGMLGALDQSYLIRLLDALGNKDGADLLAIADEMVARSLSYNSALQDLGTLLHRIALAQMVPSAVPDDLPEREDIVRLAAIFEPEEIQLFYQIAVHGRNEMGLAPDEYAGFTMTLLRMLAFRPALDGEQAQSVAARPVITAVKTATGSATQPVRPAGVGPGRAALEAARSGKAGPVVPAPPSKPGAVSPASVPPWEEAIPQHLNEPTDFSNASAQKKTESSITPMMQPSPSQQRPAAPTMASATAMAPMAHTWEAIPGLNWDGDWPRLAADLPVRGVVQQLAMQTELLKCEHESSGAQFHFRVPMDTLRSGTNGEKLAAALSERFGLPVRVSIEVGAVTRTAGMQAQEERVARQSQAEKTIQNDPFAQNMMREFGATIVPGSIKPA